MNIKNGNNPYNVSKQLVLNILKDMLKIISKYYDDIYKIEQIAQENGNDSLSIDESLFVHLENKQIWVVGIINNRTREITLFLVENTETIKKILTKFIVTDGALCYLWLDDPNNGYEYSVHNHGHRDFGYASDSTSHIESLWANLKSLIK